MTATQIRAQARQKLSSKWGKSALITFLALLSIGLICYGLNSIFENWGAIFSLLITVPLSYGFIISMFHLQDEKEISFFDFFKMGLSNFEKSWHTTLHILAKLLLFFFLIIASAIFLSYALTKQDLLLLGIASIFYLCSLLYGMIQQFSYKLAFFLLYDNPDITGKEAVAKSNELMKGNIWSLFCLDFSFIGWAFLCILTFGIGLFWLIPYLQISEITFYRDLIGQL